MRANWLRVVTLCGMAALTGSPSLGFAWQHSQIPAGTRFIVELRDTLEAKKIKKGKKFEAKTLEALDGGDGSIIPAGAKVKGRVSSVRDNEMTLRFEEIDTGRGKVPLIASVIGVSGDKDVKADVGKEGEIRTSRGRGKSAAIGGAVGAALGGAVGAAKGGGKDAAIGAGIGAAAGAGVGAASGGRDLELYKGTRLDLVLDRPLSFKRK